MASTSVSVRIDPEFQALIPPLTTDERALLEENIKRDGCRDALVVWNGVLLDGHNRHEICERLGLGYRLKEINLPSREAAADWIDTNQLGRLDVSGMGRRPSDPLDISPHVSEIFK